MRKVVDFYPFRKGAGSAIAFILLLSFYACNQNLEDALPQDVGLAAVDRQEARFIEGRYIVVLKEDRVRWNKGVRDNFDQRRAKAKSLCQGILKEKGIPEQALYSAYGFALVGFAAELSAAQVSALQQDPRIDYLEQDQVVQLIEPFSEGFSTATTVETIPVGISRVGGGAGPYGGAKRAYVIDTGILLNHPDLNVETDRTRMYNAFSDDISESGEPVTNPDPTLLPNDGNGHGTHVAGTIGAIKDNSQGVVGVAPGVQLVPVKVLGDDGSGTLSNVLEGLDFVFYDGKAADVANLSLGGSVSKTLDNAVRKVADKDIYFAIAAGNNSNPAKNYSPARVNHKNVFTIAAMSTTVVGGGYSDAWAQFSNFGQPPIDFIAPGVKVLSTYVTDGGAASYAELSGTSMAAPHVAGLLILNGLVIGTDGEVRRTSRDVYSVAHHVVQ